jgi:hypothetical protein
MKKLFTIVVLAALIGCSLPDTEKPLTEMEKYWQVYQQKQYNNLYKFYSPGKFADSLAFNDWSNQIKELDDRFGTPRQISLTGSSTEASLANGKTVQLDYQVDYQNAIKVHHFIFREEKDGEYKIAAHDIDM